MVAGELMTIVLQSARTAWRAVRKFLKTAIVHRKSAEFDILTMEAAADKPSQRLQCYEGSEVDSAGTRRSFLMFLSSELGDTVSIERVTVNGTPFRTTGEATCNGYTTKLNVAKELP